MEHKVSFKTAFKVGAGLTVGAAAPALVFWIGAFLFRLIIM
jgi:hypothetical protein